MKRYTIAIEEAVVMKRVYTVDADNNAEAIEKFNKGQGVLIEDEEQDTLSGVYGEPEPVILDREDLDD